MHKPPTVWVSKFMSKYRRDPTREIQVMHPYYLQFLSGVNERRRKFTISSDSGFNVAKSYNNGVVPLQTRKRSLKTQPEFKAANKRKGPSGGMNERGFSKK